MRIKAIFVLVAAFLAAIPSQASFREINVTPTGLTPKAAVEKIRAAKMSGDNSGWVIRVSPGTYTLKEPIVLKPCDSGTVESPVRWVGEDGAVISGGSVLEGWRDDGDGVWSLPAPLDASGKMVFFESLYVDGRRAERSRIPEEGELHFGTWKERKVVEGAVTNYVEEFSLKDSAANKSVFDALGGLSQEELDAVQCRIFVKWSYAAYSVASCDAANGLFSVVGKSAVAPWKKWDADPNNYLFFENVEAGFRKPGQWFFDVKSKRIRYRPREGEDMKTVKITAPVSRLVSLLKIEGDLDKGDFVHDISFENMSFAATRTDGDEQENGAVKQYQLQAAYRTGAAVEAEGAHRVRFLGCKVFNIENYAFKFGEGCVSNSIVSCEICDAGAGGIWIGGVIPNTLKNLNPKWRDVRNPWDYPLKTERICDTSPRAVRFNIVDDNLITNCGRVNREGCGIVLTHAADTKVTHNEISDLYYTGISVGWTWGYYGSYAQRNEISFNRITDIGQGKMADMGGIYTLAASHGTVITNNVIMNVKSRSYGGWGMYNDEGSEGVLWQNNLVVNTSAESYHLHFGRNNKVVNCIMINGGTGRICVSRNEKHNQVVFERNVIYWPEGPLFERPPKRNTLRDGKGKTKFIGNIFWCRSGVTELNGPISGIVTDPGFVDADKGDWRLKPDSNALKLGFKAWDYSLSGRRQRKR